MVSNSDPSFLQIASDTFSKAATNVLHTMGVASLEKGESTVKKNNTPDGDVTVVVHFIGHRDGYFSISFSQSFAEKILESGIEDNSPDLDNQFDDRIGKIAARIADKGRIHLQSQGYQFFPTSLAIIRGERPGLPRTKEKSSLLTPFTTEDGNFYLEVDF